MTRSANNNYFPSNSQLWVENPKTIKDLLHIADQVTRLSEIYGPDTASHKKIQA